MLPVSLGVVKLAHLADAILNKGWVLILLWDMGECWWLWRWEIFDTCLIQSNSSQDCISQTLELADSRHHKNLWIPGLRCGYEIDG
jgi:hypothetical protein